MKNLLVRFMREEEGQDIIEYALLAAFISVLSIGLILTIGTGVQGLYGTVDSAVQGVAP